MFVPLPGGLGDVRADSRPGRPPRASASLGHLRISASCATSTVSSAAVSKRSRVNVFNTASTDGVRSNSETGTRRRTAASPSPWPTRRSRTARADSRSSPSKPSERCLGESCHCTPDAALCARRPRGAATRRRALATAQRAPSTGGVARPAPPRPRPPAHRPGPTPPGGRLAGPAAHCAAKLVGRHRSDKHQI